LRGKKIKGVQINWEIDPSKGRLASQLSAQIRTAIGDGKLSPGDKLPATRQLAKELRLARGTIATAIELLVAEGLLEARTGAGTFVADEARYIQEEPIKSLSSPIGYVTPVAEPDIDLPKKARIDFRPCRPSLEAFPLNAWRRCMSAATSSLPQSDYGDPKGTLYLRRVLSDYLRRARGLSVSPDNFIVTNGAVHAMDLLALLLLSDQTTAVFENPGYPLARQVFSRTRAKMHFCEIDENGIVTDDLPFDGQMGGLAYVTPSHQFPIGSRLSLQRRRELINWAEARGALIVEDDYDGEFRFDVSPLAPLAAMAPNFVIYCGTFSKTMFPGLRIGFAAGPEDVIDAMAAQRTISEYAPNELIQRALANFIEEGEYERHVLRTRRLYKKKRRVVAELLGDHARLSGIDSGLSALLEIQEPFKAAEVSKDLERLGILIPCVSRYDINLAQSRNALILGYAQPSIEQISKGINALIDLLR